jgi:hypothetical protein
MRFSLTLSLFFLTAMFALPGPAEAGEQDGVRCPSGFDAQISSSNRNLVCVKKGAFRLTSSCPFGYLNAHEHPIDHCFKLGEAGTSIKPIRSVPSAAPPWYPPLTKFKRIVGSSDQDDVFVADDYKFPEGGPIYMGDASKGVRCPSGWDGDVRYSNRGIRCDKLDGSPKEADCDFGWSVDRDRLGQEDRCLGVNEGPTKPMGMTKIHFDAQRSLATVGWLLDKRNGTDTWQKKLYRYPDVVE